jgi:hypothetical protein
MPGFEPDLKGHTMRYIRSPRTLIAAACILAWLGAVRAADRSPAAMADAATKFLSALTPEQRQQATFAFDSSEREHWGFVPSEMFPRNGLTIGAMSEPQRKLAHDLLRSGLSQRGYLTASSIMDLEAVLRVIEEAARQNAPQGQGNPQGRGNAAPLVRDPLKYYVSVFGTPAARGTWGWRVEGHHVSLNFTIVGGSMVASAPSFFGSNPAEVREGEKKGLRILAAEEDSARALLMALDESQRAKAVMSDTAPNDIATMNTVKIEPLATSGIAYRDLRPNQREMLMKVVDSYVSAMASDIAADRMARVKKAGLEAITFAWAGEAERGKRHYYRVQGPTFLIEFDNTQNNANHIHSVWRDFQGDFGRDLLREHLKTSH